jgi:hypothetical protein
MMILLSLNKQDAMQTQGVWSRGSALDNGKWRASEASAECFIGNFAPFKSRNLIPQLHSS